MIGKNLEEENQNPIDELQKLIDKQKLNEAIQKK